MARFRHTNNRQLGGTHWCFLESVQKTYSQVWCDAMRTVGRIAKEEKSQSLLVCGDVFESIYVNNKMSARALENASLKESTYVVG